MEKIIIEDKNFNDGKTLIFLMADIVDSKYLLETLYKNKQNVILMLKEKWLKTTDLSGAWAIMVEEDYDNPKAWIEKIEEIIRLQKTDCRKQIICLSEKNIETVGFLNSYFNFEGIKEKQAEAFRDKLLMRETASSSGVLQPRFFALHDVMNDPSLLNGINKYILKPRKLWGSEGVKVCDNFQVLNQHVQEKKLESDQFLVEEFIPGDLYFIDTTQADGEPAFYSVGVYVQDLLTIAKNKNAYFMAHTLKRTNPISQRILQAHQKIAKAFKYDDGLTHMEFFITPNEQIYFCEGAARPPGMSFIEFHSMTTNLNALQIYGETLSGSQPLTQYKSNVAGMISFTPGKGKLISCTNIDEFNDPKIVKKEQNIEIGKEYESDSYLHELGRIYLKEDSEDACASKLNHFASEFHCEVI
ncbi:MAG: ATP-grasp domain-containing protein [Oligoflexia bacterium]|nr:ATP-grasp domain-containing protein [Oligoflexia bacterium]